MNKQKNNFFSNNLSRHRFATIICTIGPTCNTLDMLKKLIYAGMNVARLNFSHGTHEEKKQLIKLIRKAEKETGKPIAILQDLQGPKLRVGELKGGGPVNLINDSTVTLTTEPCFGTAEKFYVDYKNLPNEVQPGDPVLLADGTIALQVIKKSNKEVKCRIIHGGELFPRKGVNLPGVKMSVPSLTPKDVKDLKFGVEHGVDWIALSFVREAKDITKLRARIKRLRSSLKKLPTSIPPKIIAKIEKPEAVENLDDILDKTDGIMVARGDLGVELNISKVPIIQKEMIHLANKIGKPVITATQMLESMTHAAIPTRAEASDVANAIFDGTDAVMLSAETAFGKFPEEAVKALNLISRQAEYSHLFNPGRCEIKSNTMHAIAASASDTAEEINASSVVVYTYSGNAAIKVASFRPKRPILALCTNVDVARQLMVYWNIKTITVRECKNINQMLTLADKKVIEANCGKSGDSYVLIAGTPGESGKTDFLHVRKLK